MNAFVGGGVISVEMLSRCLVLAVELGSSLVRSIETGYVIQAISLFEAENVANHGGHGKEAKSNRVWAASKCQDPTIDVPPSNPTQHPRPASKVVRSSPAPCPVLDGRHVCLCGSQS